MKAQPLIVYLPDTRGVEVSRYGMGNAKIGFGVFTYSRPAGNPARRLYDVRDVAGLNGAYRVVTNSRSANPGGTCPGSTDECERICYAKRIAGPVREIYNGNIGNIVPVIPAECTLLRIHVSGDFDDVRYIEGWIQNLEERPDVTAWAYTRSWRVPELLPALERLRALANVQLFASMDKSHSDVPPSGWRRAWIDGDIRAGQPLLMRAHGVEVISKRNTVTYDRGRSYVCPEETKHKANCAECGYCFEGQRNDVTFLEH